MHYFRIILGLILGLLIGAVVNGSIIHLGTMLFPYPKGVDLTTLEGMNAFRDLPVKFYIFPFLAHAIGTLSGCLTALIFLKNKFHWVIYVIAYLFFVGGVVAVDMINAPVWFDLIDLSLAYLPMGWLALRSRLAKTA